MRTTSQQFITALGGPHRIHAEVEIWDTGTGTWEDSPVTGGKVSADYYADVMRTVTLDAAPAATSLQSANRLDPENQIGIYGTYMRVYRGIQFPNGTLERIPMGVFTIDSLKRKRPDATVQVTGTDLYMQINRARLLKPRTLKGASRIQIVQDLVKEALEPNLPWGQVQFWVHPDVEDYRLAATMVERDRGKAIRDILGGISAKGYFDPEGRFVIAPLADPDATAPVWSVKPGAGGTLISYDEDVNRDGVYNAVAVSAETNDEDTAPLFALATDDDPSSPTYWDGPFGKVPLFYTSQYIYTQEQANLAATRRLVAVKGASHRHKMASVPNPALEPGDVVRFYSVDGEAANHLIAVMQVGLSAEDPMSMDTIVGRRDGGLLPGTVLIDDTLWADGGTGYAGPHPSPSTESGGMRVFWATSPTGGATGLKGVSTTTAVKSGRSYLVQMTVRAATGAAPWRIAVRGKAASDQWYTPVGNYKEAELLFTADADEQVFVGIEVEPDDWATAGNHLVTLLSVLEYAETPGSVQAAWVKEIPYA